MKYLPTLILSFLFLSSYAQKQVKLEDIKDHIGDSVEVRGQVFGIRYLETAQNTPTLINMGAAYPNQLLTVVIWGDVRKQFKYNLEEEQYAHGVAIVAGKVELYKDKPQMLISDPKQLKFIVEEVVPDQLPPTNKKKGK